MDAHPGSLPMNLNDPPQGISGWRGSAVVLYALMFAAAFTAFLAIAGLGSNLAAPPADTAAAVGAATSHTAAPLPHLLLALVVLIMTCRLLGYVFRRLGQPPVIGEVVAGILLGPTLLGRIAPGAYEYLLPQAAASHLAIIAQLGVILYMFLVGLDFDVTALRQRGHAAVAISHASIIAPFLLGSALALVLYPILSNDRVSFTVFSLFLGVSMSVTAFPVLARILSDRHMHKTRLGTVALACAAMDDVSAWCLLAIVVGVARAEVGAALAVAALTLIYIAAMFLGVRPLLAWLMRGNGGETSQKTVAVVLMALFLSAWLTESIGIHAVFGAFLLGAVIPRDGGLVAGLRAKLEDIVTIVLLPAFFAIAGMRTQIGLISGLQNWLLCGAIIIVASLGKFGGTLVAARLGGLKWRESSALGILMNTRGLMELIVLNIGLDLGLISPRLYALMIIMALVTTMMTTPIMVLLGFGGAKQAGRQADTGGFTPDDNTVESLTDEDQIAEQAPLQASCNRDSPGQNLDEKAGTDVPVSTLA